VRIITGLVETTGAYRATVGNSRQMRDGQTDTKTAPEIY